jgi:hypothetical protein
VASFEAAAYFADDFVLGLANWVSSSAATGVSDDLYTSQTLASGFGNILDLRYDPVGPTGTGIPIEDVNSATLLLWTNRDSPTGNNGLYLTDSAESLLGEDIIPPGPPGLFPREADTAVPLDLLTGTELANQIDAGLELVIYLQIQEKDLGDTYYIDAAVISIDYNGASGGGGDGLSRKRRLARRRRYT